MSPATGLDRKQAIVPTRTGKVRAGKVVLATNAWAAALPELRLRIVPLTSQIVLTPPIKEVIEDIGWTGGELVKDSRLLVHYMHVTRDDRIVFERGGGAIGPAGRVTRKLMHDPSLAAQVAADLQRFWPQLNAVPIEQSWGGAVDRSAHHMPFFSPIDDSGRILVGAGFSGKGVGPTCLGGRILSSLVREEKDEWSRCALVGLPERVFPPEPLRTIGGMIIRDAVARAEAHGERGTTPGLFTQGLAKLAWASFPSFRQPQR